MQEQHPEDAESAQVSRLESVPRLREDVEEAQAEVSRAQEQEQMKQIEVAELQRQRNELRQQLHEAEEAHRAVSHTLCITVHSVDIRLGFGLSGHVVCKVLGRRAAGHVGVVEQTVFRETEMLRNKIYK